MKKIIAYLLLVTLVFTMATGCKKKEVTDEVDLEQAAQTGEEQTEKGDDSKKQEEASKEVEYILYLRYKDKPFLYDEIFSININDEKLKDKSMEQFIVEQLISFEPQGDIISPVPEGTKILSVERKDKNVIVNLSKEFIEKKMSGNDAMLTVGSIINSIVAIPGNETAQIFVEGKPLEKYNGVKTSEPMYFLEGLFPDK
ncbi:GerMN domain-containing protein [Wukongibacter baidiensis]|uniref:GerMN domain-containing protein n=1 Tax=Wukongibacter baidiensis TaxID=1723361 RepID=UPI003D7F65A2